jgi:hypothetical protein
MFDWTLLNLQPEPSHLPQQPTIEQPIRANSDLSKVVVARSAGLFLLNTHNLGIILSLSITEYLQLTSVEFLAKA